MQNLVGQFMVRDHFSDGRPGPAYEVFPDRAQAEAARAVFGANALITRIETQCETCGAVIDPEGRGIDGCADCR